MHACNSPPIHISSPPPHHHRYIHTHEKRSAECPTNESPQLPVVHRRFFFFLKPRLAGVFKNNDKQSFLNIYSPPPREMNRALSSRHDLCVCVSPGDGITRHGGPCCFRFVGRESRYILCHVRTWSSSPDSVGGRDTIFRIAWCTYVHTALQSTPRRHVHADSTCSFLHGARWSALLCCCGTDVGPRG